MKEGDFYNKAWEEWNDMIDNSPAPFHRRRIILNIINGLKERVTSIADVGCGNGRLIREMNAKNGELEYVGYDISKNIIDSNQKNFKHFNNIQWKILDLNNDGPSDIHDIIVCSEVLEHIENWEKALSTLIAKSRKYLLITVPAGKVFPIDRKVGHYQHFSRKKLIPVLRKYDLKYRLWYWGFPFHILYKYLINIKPEQTYKSFGKGSYGFFEKTVSGILKILFYLNIRTGFKASQLFAVLDKTEHVD